MKITLIGMGSGCPESLTVQGYAALREAGPDFRGRRLLSALPAGCTENRAAAYLPDEILELLHASRCENAALLYSGDHRVLLRGFGTGGASAGTGISACGAARPFQRADALCRAGPSLAGLEARLGPWPRLRPGGRVHGGQSLRSF